MSGNRDDLFFNRELANVSFLQSSFVAVKVGEEWQYFSPAEMYTPFGMLGWPEESQETLITDPKEPVWTRTTTSPPQKSLAKRTAKLRLLEDGTLEGDVKIEYTGHLSYERKEYNDDDSPAQREETLRESVKDRMSTAELSNILIENVTDPIKPFTYSYHIRVPGYAQRTGKRIFLQPGFFEHGRAPMFSASDRKHSVYFHYPWQEEDDIFIDLPAGYALDNADAPPDVPAAFTQGVSAQKVTLAVTKDGRGLRLKRTFFFGGKNMLTVPGHQLRQPQTAVRSVSPATTITR